MGKMRRKPDNKNIVLIGLERESRVSMASTTVA
jgi:hypothetical protein